MDNTEPSETSPNSLSPADAAAPSPDDIPEAKRDAVPPSSPSRRLWWIGGVAGAIAAGGILFAIAQALLPPVVPDAAVDDSDSVATTDSASSAENPDDSNSLDTPSPGDSQSNAGTASSTLNEDEAVDSVLGHLAYEEAPPGDLQPIVADGSIKLRTAAANQLLAMLDDARASGVSILAISGYRSFEDQEYLFFEVKAERGQTARTRAEVSAPPGYSEHHTGYAVDLVDGTRPETDLRESFESTAAFQWLERNAARYGFELSFPRDNEQGISYEPWHWRYVGDPHSLETFYKQRTPVEENSAPSASPSAASSSASDAATGAATD